MVDQNDIRKRNGKRIPGKRREGGFSLIELIVAVVISAIMLGAIVTVFQSALNIRKYELSRSDAITSTQAALNIMSREIGNAGFGLKRGIFASNGLIQADCNATRLHFRTNTNNLNSTANDQGENVTFYYDANTSSIVRYDPNANPTTSAIVNQVSNVQFQYFDYDANGTATQVNVPTDDTSRIRIKLTVLLVSDPTDVTNKRNVTIESDITLRNAPYNIGQY
jgi:prepilin-type N-terminal cleavage/methylation domain-containing protein